MTLMQLVEAKPIVTAISTFVAIGAFVALLFTIDERYAHAGDLRQLSLQVEMSALQARQASLQDRIFDLEQKKKTQADQASLSRYKNELGDVQRQLQQKRQLADQMKAGR